MSLAGGMSSVCGMHAFFVYGGIAQLLNTLSKFLVSLVKSVFIRVNFYNK